MSLQHPQEATGHTVSTARKQRVVNGGTQLTFSFVFTQSGTPALRMVPPIFMVDHPTSVNSVSKTPH